jgi:hypothetical protein
MEDSLTLDRPEAPDELAVLCGPTRYQADFELEAVGLESDSAAVAEKHRSTIRPIDDLSYAPKDGWNIIDVAWFQNVDISKKDRDLARQTVFRWYRIKAPPPGLKQPDQRKRIVLETTQVETTTEDERVIDKPAQVYGIWYPNYNDRRNVETEFDPQGDTDSPFYRAWTLDTKRQVVKFANHVYRNSEHDIGAANPAKLVVAKPDLRLRCAFTMLLDETRATNRYGRNRKTGLKNGTPTRFLRHDELQFTWVPAYRNDFSVQSWTNNQADVDRACDHYLDAAFREYDQSMPQTIKYLGLRSVSLDGAIQQITLTVGKSGATTIVSRNTEQLARVQPYRFRRLMEKQGDAAVQGQQAAHARIAKQMRRGVF